ncbi:hypothetical protein DXG01_004614 [Tephrocybe rancida]|nr:hypothetical protein DXG01_004614 [Tephrocybe rancida]
MDTCRLSIYGLLSTRKRLTKGGHKSTGDGSRGDAVLPKATNLPRAYLYNKLVSQVRGTYHNFPGIVLYMNQEIIEQISRLRKDEWVDLQGLILCATTHLSNAGLPNPSCVSISLLGWGSCNTAYKLTFSDGIQLAATVSAYDEEEFSPQAKRSEIETMRFVRDSGLYPDVPVPMVHAWDTTFTNSAGAPYVLMDLIPGRTLNSLGQGSRDRLFGLEALAPAQQLSVLKSLAKLQASISRPVPFNKIGSLTVDEDGKRVIGPLFNAGHQGSGGPYNSAQELWRAQLETEILRALKNWDSLKTDEIRPHNPICSPQAFAELYQLLSSLIPHFEPPKPYLSLVLHHPDIALRNVFFDDTEHLKITGVIDWGGSQIPPIMLTACYPDDLMTDNFYPYPRPGYITLSEDWGSVPCDWTSFDTSQASPSFEVPNDPVDYLPRASAMVRLFYLRTFYSGSYAEQMNMLHNDADLARATLFLDASYYLKFHEVVSGTWFTWAEHANWIRETYWRMRALAKDKCGQLVIGPNVYRGPVERPICDLRISGEYVSVKKDNYVDRVEEDDNASRAGEGDTDLDDEDEGVKSGDEN